MSSVFCGFSGLCLTAECSIFHFLFFCNEFSSVACLVFVLFTTSVLNFLDFRTTAIRTRPKPHEVTPQQYESVPWILNSKVPFAILKIPEPSNFSFYSPVHRPSTKMILGASSISSTMLRISQVSIHNLSRCGRHRELEGRRKGQLCGFMCTFFPSK